MKSHVRASVAAVALSHCLDKKVSSIYSYEDSGYVNIEVGVIEGRVNGYDYSNSCHIDGQLPSLYHYGESSHLELRPKGSGTYDGYDYGSGCHLEVKVNGAAAAEVYDYGSGGYFSYCI